MSEIKNKFHILEKMPFQYVIVFVLLFLGGLLTYHNYINSNQAIGATAAKLQFEGEYRIGESQWQKIVQGQHISATKGDVTLKGNFHIYSPGGEYIGVYSDSMLIAFYTDHIGVTIYESGKEPYFMDAENPMFGYSACGVDWTAYSFTKGNTEPIKIVIHNPHQFGNENAVDDLLSNFAFWAGIDFERDVLSSGRNQRNAGLFFIMVSFVLLGIALFSTLLHIQKHRIIWQLGMTIMSAGIYLAFSAFGVSFWNESVAVNTTALGVAMMLYMFFILQIVTYLLKDTKKIGMSAMAAIGLFNAICFILPVCTQIYFYDIWGIWVIAQTIANLVVLGCLIKEWVLESKKIKWYYIGLSLLLIVFEVDVLANLIGRWKGGLLSKYAFVILFVMSLIFVLRIIPGSINAAAKAKELELQRSRLEAEKNMIEAKLNESRISIMLSQIQPHFIYNTLGTIERMCLKDPEKAFDLVRNFSLYLRGNFSELDSVIPIRFREEMKHVEVYANIEKVRFPDMTIEYCIEAEDFVLPALSVQPLVENAIKHGLMRLETGGTVVIHSYETEDCYCVEVKDNGAGFDTQASFDEKKHVGLRNIKGRLKAMVNGELTIESQTGVGTKATIRIPKDVI